MHYPETPGFKGSSGTGREAAEYYAGQVNGRRLQVMDGLRSLGVATAEQIAAKIDLHWYLVRPRLSECKALGLVVETGERGKGALGGKVNTWRLLTEEERSLFLARKAVTDEKGLDQ